MGTIVKGMLSSGDIDPASCTTTSTDNLNSPNAIAFYGPHAYITNAGSNSVVVCNVTAADGDLGPSYDTILSSGLVQPNGIAIRYSR